MNSKHLSLFASLLVVGWYNIVQSESGIAYSDTAKLMSRINEQVNRSKLCESLGKNLGKGDIANASLLYVTGITLAVYGLNSQERRDYGFSREALRGPWFIDSMRHNLWYNCNNDKDLDKELHLVDVILEPALFTGANLYVPLGLNKINEFDAVKNIVEYVPEEHRSFIFENGRMFVTAALARGGRILVQEGSNGLNGKNGKKFLKDAGMHVGSEFTETYIMNPIVDKVVGNNDCLSGDILKVCLNAATFYALNSMMSK